MFSFAFHENIVINYKQSRNFSVNRFDSNKITLQIVYCLLALQSRSLLQKPTDPSIYRPISFLSSLNKIEKIILLEGLILTHFGFRNTNSVKIIAHQKLN